MVQRFESVDRTQRQASERRKPLDPVKAVNASKAEADVLERRQLGERSKVLAAEIVEAQIRERFAIEKAGEEPGAPLNGKTCQSGDSGEVDRFLDALQGQSTQVW